MTFVDVGAHIGYFSIIAAALVGEKGAVHSFEPDPDCFSRLVVNSAVYPWVKAHNSAVADRNGEISFYRSPMQNESGWGAIFDVEGSEYRVVEGAQALIARIRPLMWVEANSVCLSRDAKSASLLLGRLIGWDYITQGLWDRRCNSVENIVAIPRERADLLERIARANLGLRSTDRRVSL